jgi:hypothetical protein
MGAHKGKKKMDQMSMVRYWSPATENGIRFKDRRTMNKYRRVLRCNGEAFAVRWKAKYAA